MNIPFTKVESSNVEGFGYDEATQRLNVTFKGGALYHYDGVPYEAAAALAAAASFGSHLAKHIKPLYPARKVEL